MFEKLNYPDSVDILFLGDSHTERADFYVLFSDYRVVSQGIGGDVSAGLLHRLPLTSDIKAKYIVLEIGVNDLIKGNSVDGLLGNYKEIIARLKKMHPSSRLIIETIYPVTEDFEKGEERYITKEKIKEANSEIKELARQNGCLLIDSYQQFSTKEGYLKDNYSCEGLHLKGEAYVWLRDEIIKTINADNS